MYECQRPAGCGSARYLVLKGHQSLETLNEPISSSKVQPLSDNPVSVPDVVKRIPAHLFGSMRRVYSSDSSIRE